jgi:hypothetical protein
MKLRNFRVQALASLLLILVAFFACRKIYDRTSTEYKVEYTEAIDYLSTLAKNEESLLDLPFSQLPKLATMRRFARLNKLEKVANWNNAQRFHRNQISAWLVPVGTGNTTLESSSVATIPSLLITKRDGDKMELNILEIYSNKDGSLGTSIAENAKIAAENMLFKEEKPLSISACAIFYDRYYSYASSFTAQHGLWKNSHIVVENTDMGRLNAFIKASSQGNKVNVRSSPGKYTSYRSQLPTVSPLSTCGVSECTLWGMFRITYDNDGNIISEDLLYTWDECSGNTYPPSGSPPANNNPNAPAYNKSVTNAIVNPCIGNVLTVNSNRISNFVGGALNNEDVYRPMLFTYGETYDYDPHQTGGLVSWEDDPSTGMLKFNINVNANILPTASKEIMYQTFIHEALHGVLLSKGVAWDNIIQHEEMANYYRGLIQNELQVTFPGIPLSEAVALSWAGLQISTAYTNLPKSRKDDIAYIIGAHLDPSSSGLGHGC